MFKIKKNKLPAKQRVKHLKLNKRKWLKKARHMLTNKSHYSATLKMDQAIHNC